MKRSLWMLLLFASFPLVGRADAPQNPQNAISEGRECIAQIEEASQGAITVNIPDAVLERMFRDDAVQQRKAEPALRPGINKLSGYRIQVFGDGHNQSSLESRARARGNAIVARLPKYRGQVYSFSSAPNWYTRIGNFRSSAEASAALAELKRTFPQFAADMRVVKSQIVVIK